MSKRRRTTQHKSASLSKTAVSDAAEPRHHGSTQLTLQAGEAAALTGTAAVTVILGTAWVAGKVLVSGASTILTADAKFGGPLHIQALPDQQQVPLATIGSVTFEVASIAEGAAGSSDSDKLSYKAQLLTSAQMATRRYPQSWLQASEDMVRAAHEGCTLSVAVTGSKGVGKSTLARLLVNSLLEACPVVAFLDTDCGQSELTVPGLVSLTLLDKPLFGPPHMHMRHPTRSHFIGDLSPQGNPLHYLSSVRSLHQWYWSQCDKQQDGPHATPPLVINTHGWIKGLGLDLLAQVLESTRPCHVMQLVTHNPNSNLPPHAWWQPEDTRVQRQPVVYQLPSVGALQPDIQGDTACSWAPRQPPSEQRSLQWLAFARQCIGQNHTPGSWDLPAFAAAADNLAAYPPYKVPLSHFNVVFHEASIAAPQVLQALNGAVVALTMAVSKDKADGSNGNNTATEAAASICLGIGLVRSVDPDKQMLYVLTPTPLHLLEKATTLEVGKLDLPLALLQTSTFMSPYISIWSITADGTGAGAMKARNTLLRNRLKPGN